MASSRIILISACASIEYDYMISILSDACVDPDQAVHNMLMEKVLPCFGYIHTIDEFIQATEIIQITEVD